MELFNIIWFAIIGIFIGWISTIIIVPESKTYGDTGIFVLALLGAILLGLLTPGFGIFVAPFIFIGSLIMALLGAMLFVWIITTIILMLPPTSKEIKK